MLVPDLRNASNALDVKNMKPWSMTASKVQVAGPVAGSRGNDCQLGGNYIRTYNYSKSGTEVSKAS